MSKPPDFCPERYIVIGGNAYALADEETTTVMVAGIWDDGTVDDTSWSELEDTTDMNMTLLVTCLEALPVIRLDT